MPSYDFKCKDCGSVQELFMGISDSDSIVPICPLCNGDMAKTMITPPISINTGYRPSDARYTRGRGRY